jgi:site-specific DNA recombinase
VQHDKAPLRRCAIYTRKSSEEGLEQDFNSLHAQREACESFIKSQQGEGWRLIKTSYDDGGLSGGTMERPALQRLLADIGHGLIDVVVVYKVDRLTRSLADFAKMVEVFDARGVSFVAVTQQFNTTTSMGRLTLNVLLSFAQFEREVTGERIRDKIAASKRKGMWMGGFVPLGYDVRERQIVVNETEAEAVRYIFRRYGELGCVRLLKEDLDRRGIVSKRRAEVRHPIRRSTVFARSPVCAALESDLRRRDPSQGPPPSGSARSDIGPRALGAHPTATPRTDISKENATDHRGGESTHRTIVRRARRGSHAEPRPQG